jgi:hypothetical protein
LDAVRAAKHVNSVPSQNNVDGLELARLNLEVGEKAVGVSAFVPASRYLQKGLDALEMVTYPWRSCYNLSLRLHRAAVDVELCLGNFELGHKLSEKIFQNAVSVQDKLPSSLSLANALGRHARHAEAFELCKKALFRLGEFPRRFHISHLLGGEEPLPAADSSDTFRLIAYYQARAQIAYYFVELELAERMARKLCAHSKPDLAYTGTTIRVFFCGLIGSALARKAGRTKYKRQARQALKKMKRVTARWGAE